jgi:hypothetical protein
LVKEIPPWSVKNASPHYLNLKRCLISILEFSYVDLRW